MASPYSGCALFIYSGAICPLLCMLPLYIHRAPSGISLCFVCCRLGSQRRIVIVAATSKMQPHTHAHLCVLSALCILRVIWLLLCVYACASTRMLRVCCISARACILRSPYVAICRMCACFCNTHHYSQNCVPFTKCYLLYPTETHANPNETNANPNETHANPNEIIGLLLGNAGRKRLICFSPGLKNKKIKI